MGVGIIIQLNWDVFMLLAAYVGVIKGRNTSDRFHGPCDYDSNSAQRPAPNDFMDDAS